MIQGNISNFQGNISCFQMFLSMPEYFMRPIVYMWLTLYWLYEWWTYFFLTMDRQEGVYYYALKEES